MQFPVYMPLGPFPVHPHPFFETLAYFLGFRVYLWLRHRRGDHVSEQHRGAVMAAAAVGGAAGSKLISLASDPLLTWAHRTDPAYLAGGKGIVGALVGGLIAVELAKRLLGLRRRTGDLFALPLAVGIAVGRIGCFLTGLDDHTHGLPTALPWGVNYGDGVTRHPAQLYEIVFLVVLSAWLWRLLSHPGNTRREGDVFKTFMVGYLGFRFWLEWLKPGVPLLGLNATQWVCLGTLLYYARDLPTLLSYLVPGTIRPAAPAAVPGAGPPLISPKESPSG